MKIGVVYLGRRGAGCSISIELARAFAGMSEVFVVISSQAENVSRWRTMEIDTLEVSTYSHAVGALLSWANQPRIWRLANQIRARNPDVLFYPMIHTWTPFLQYYLRKVPSVVTVHDPLPHPGFVGRLNGFLEYLGLRLATRCIILSERQRNTLHARGVPPNRLDVVPLGALSYPEEHLAPWREACTESPILLFFGRIAPYKGLDVLLKAFRQLARQRPDIRLKIVGSGDMRPYAALLRDLQNIEVINRWIPDSEVANHLAEASMLILPYTSASQSGVVAVAASLGLPVIATRVGGIPEQINDGVTGLLIDPGSTEQLVQAIECLLDNPGLPQQLGRNLYLDFRQNRSWDAIAQMIYIACGKAVKS